MALHHRIIQAIEAGGQFPLVAHESTRAREWTPTVVVGRQRLRQNQRQLDGRTNTLDYVGVRVVHAAHVGGGHPLYQGTPRRASFRLVLRDDSGVRRPGPAGPRQPVPTYFPRKK